MKTKLNKPRSLVSLDAKKRRAGKMKDKRQKRQSNPYKMEKLWQ